MKPTRSRLRPGFVLAMLAAALAISGCSDRASTEAAPGSARLFYASRIGCVSDGDLAAGTFTTDNSAAINRVLALASPSNPIELIVDGVYGATGLDVGHGYVTIRGLGTGTGFVNTRRTAASDVITNASTRTYFAHGTTAPVGGHVLIEDLTIHGCRPDGDKVRRNAMSVHLENLDDIRIVGCGFAGFDAYAIELAACTRYVVDGCAFTGAALVEQPSWGSGQAGVQVEGADSFGTITNCYFHTNDDAIAINLGENALTSSPPVSGAPGRSHIVSNCHFDGCLNAIRYYAGSQSASGLVVDNAIATCFYHFVIINVEDGGGSGPHRDLSFSNCQATIAAPPWGGPGPAAYFAVDGLVRNLQISNFAMISPTQGVPLLGCNGNSAVAGIGSCSIDNLVMHYDADGAGPDYLADYSQLPIGELRVNGFRQVVDAGTKPTAPYALIRLTGAHGGSRIGLHDCAVTCARNIVAVQNDKAAGVADAILITGLDASGLSGHAVDLSSGLAPRTVLLDGLWSDSTDAPVWVGSGVTLPNLVAIGLASTQATPWSGAGSVTNLVTRSSGTYGGP
jgi:hypothetical protein